MDKISISSIPLTEVSHAPGVMKQVILANGRVPSLTNFSRAMLSSGQETEPHTHKDMSEVFFVVEGAGVFYIDNTPIDATVGDCVLIEPGEQHHIKNAAKEPLVLLYFGIEHQD